MGESSFAKLDHRIPLARAEVRGTTPVDLVERMDGVTHSPLSNPDAPNIHGWSPPADPVPTETELRERLIEALDLEAHAARAALDAEAAHARALDHLDKARADLDGFSDLDSAIASSVIDSLRDDTALVTDFDEAILARDRARTIHQAAEVAQSTLRAEHVAAQHVATTATQAVEKIIVAILYHEATRMADRHNDLVAQASVIADHLRALNLHAGGHAVPMPSKVRTILGNDLTALARARDKSQWVRAAAALRDDPATIVEIA
jgi:hypothetical protein